MRPISVIGSMLLAGWIAFPAHAYPLPDHPLPVSQFHCRQLLYAAGDKRPLDQTLLAEMAGQSAATSVDPETLAAIWQLTAGRPDWGFLIGRRWETASRAQRKTLNLYITALFVRRYHISPVTAYKDTCAIDVTITSLPEEKLPDIRPGYYDFPQPRALEAVAQTKLPNGIPLVYTLVKYPGRKWVIDDLSVNGQSLKATYEAEYNHILAEQGWDGLTRYLVQQNNTR